MDNQKEVYLYHLTTQAYENFKTDGNSLHLTQRLEYGRCLLFE